MTSGKRSIELNVEDSHKFKLQKTDEGNVCASQATAASATSSKQPGNVGDTRTPAPAQDNSCTAADVAGGAADCSSGLVPLKVRYAASSDKGTRTTMEDVHVTIAAQADDPDNSNRVWHFAVYDGHGGARCATVASQRLHTAVLEAGLLTFKGPAPPRAAHAAVRAAVQSAAGAGAATTASKGVSSSAVAGSAAGAAASAGFQLDVKAAKQAIVQGFTKTDEQLLQECSLHNWTDGATCVAVWLVGSTALVANIGDAKCVLARRPQQGSSSSGGQGKDASSGFEGLRGVVLTKDHLAMFPDERSRIEKAGGHVTADGRLNGRMQVSRSFGDAQFKGSGCSAVPAVTAFSVGQREVFLLCGCDGFWSVMDPQGAVDFVAQQLQQGKDPKAATNRLLHEVVTERRCKDNCTVLLVVFD